jgi:hypothetical protein
MGTFGGKIDKAPKMDRLSEIDGKFKEYAIYHNDIPEPNNQWTFFNSPLKRLSRFPRKDEMIAAMVLIIPSQMNQHLPSGSADSDSARVGCRGETKTGH